MRIQTGPRPATLPGVVHDLIRKRLLMMRLNLALYGGGAARKKEVSDALRKLAAGRYGTCENCGTPIVKARLLTQPAVRDCAVCGQKRFK